MNLILHFIIGFTTSFLGTVPPSMLNMTTTKITLEKTKKEGLKFAIGVSIIVLIQAYIAVLFAKYIHNNENFERYIKTAGIVIFGLLSFYFFRQANAQRKQQKNTKFQIKNSFLIGLILSSLNMFAIPFYCGVSSALNMLGWLEFNRMSIFLFVLGSAFGTYALLYIYASSAVKIQSRASLLTKNLNYVLSILTAIVSMINLINIL